ncbi:amino acid ABC transporter ATP-binding/permease protein [Paraglaciecola arctica]|uniref:amino acid ABC transporter ATP-binding/permease protein n=1 Tax=Paraglaciecola arctica TaxID=1128911 RepID=UPI001C0683C1|nr:ATP-binding cassette domain-containing protein [Paraglaciecola arctica]MBU3003697.1 ATP-binding cassette domain-containing protein [Paraglaciecola arctica]
MLYWFKLIHRTLGNRLYIGIFWSFLTMLSGVALLMLSGWFITATALTGISIAAAIVVTFDMYMPGSGIRFFALSRTIGRYVERMYNHDSILRLVAAFRVTLFKQLSVLPDKQLRASSDSEWLSRLTADIDALDGILLRYIIPPIAALLLITTLCIFMAFYWLNFALVAGLVMLLCLGLTVRLKIKHSKAAGVACSNLLNETRAAIIEHLQGAFELQASQLMQQHERATHQALEGFYQAQYDLNNKLANFQLVLDVILSLCMLSVIAIVLYMVSHGGMHGGIAVMLVMMSLGMSEILQSFPALFSTWGKTHYAANRLLALTNTSPLPQADEHFELSVIDMTIHNHPQIGLSQSQPIALKFAAKQLINIQGKSGAGKSTIANLLIGSEPSGNQTKVLINQQHELSAIAATTWHNTVGYLQQSNAILSGSLGYNLVIGLTDVSEDAVWDALKKVELDEWANSLPEGLNTWLGETDGKVSGGQARRICLARLILRQQPLVLLDEPFNGIDHQMAARIWDNLNPWLENKTVVLLTHHKPEYLNAQPNLIEVDVNPK